MKKQIESLRAVLDARKADFKAKQEEAKEEFKVKREEAKTEFKINREEFASSLEGLGDEERRVKMMEFIQKGG